MKVSPSKSLTILTQIVGKHLMNITRIILLILILSLFGFGESNAQKKSKKESKKNIVMTKNILIFMILTVTMSCSGQNIVDSLETKAKNNQIPEKWNMELFNNDKKC